MMEDKDWLKGLRNKMKDYEEPVPEGLWEGIESSVFPEKRHRVLLMPVLWRSVAVAAVIAMGIFTGLRLSESDIEKPLDKSQEFLASGKPSSSVISEGGRDSAVEVVASKDKSGLLADNRPVYKRSVPATVTTNKAESTNTTSVTSFVSSVAEPVDQPGTEEKEPVSDVRVVTEPETRIGMDKKSVASVHEGEDWSNYLSATDDSKKTESKGAVLDVSLSGASTDVRNESFYDLQMFYRGSAPASTNGLIPDGGNNHGDDSQIQTRGNAPMYSKNDATKFTSKSDHKRPVRIAMTVSYPISRTFGVETGVAYSTLRSTFSNEVGNTVSKTEQTLRYLGVPLNVTASVLDSKWISVYATGGGMVEKCLSGKTATTDLLSGVMQGEIAQKDLDVKPLLWSLNASAGLQANLTKRLGVYVEPGLSYHFDDGSDVQTIYKERPLDFMLTFGARFSLK